MLSSTISVTMNTNSEPEQSYAYNQGWAWNIDALNTAQNMKNQSIGRTIYIGEDELFHGPIMTSDTLMITPYLYTLSATYMLMYEYISDLNEQQNFFTMILNTRQ